MADEIVPQKQCPRCKNTYPATSEYFWSDKHSTDGFYSRCKCCGHSKIVRETLPDGFKRCITCKELLPDTAENFPFRSKKTGILRGECLICYYASHALWRDNNREYYLDYHKQYRTKNAEQISHVKRMWYAIHRLEVLPKNAITGKKWASEHPDRVRLLGRVGQHRRKARLRAAVGNHDASDIELLLRSQKGRCWWCGKKIKGGKYHVDHRIPLVRGGSNAPENLCISCPHCNESKGKKLPQEWNGRLL